MKKYPLITKDAIAGEFKDFFHKLQSYPNSEHILEQVNKIARSILGLPEKKKDDR